MEYVDSNSSYVVANILEKKEYDLDFLTLELTRACNLKCTHCYSESSPSIPLKGKMELKDWKKVIYEGSTMGCKNIQFIGGEATIHPNISDLIVYAHSIGYQIIDLYTNGTYFPQHLKEIFKRFNVSLAFSVYSDNPLVHDLITNLTGSFEKTIRNIIWAINQKLKVRVGIIEMESNRGSVEQTKSFLYELGVEQLESDYVRGVGRGCNEKQAHDYINELCGECVHNRLCITSSGEIYPCVFSRLWTIGNIKRGLRAALMSPSLKRFKKEINRRNIELNEYYNGSSFSKNGNSYCLLHSF